MITTSAAIVAGAVLASGAAASAASMSRKSPDAPDYAAASREGVMADLESLPIRRMIDAAARAGTKVSYTDPATGKTKTADFTGLGDADLSKIQLDWSLESADRIAKAQIELQAKYGEEEIRQRLKELQLADPEGFAARKEMGRQVSEDLARGTELDPELRDQVTEQERAAQALRGNVMGQSAGAAEALSTGEAGLRLKQQRLANASAFLSGTTPVAQFAQISGAQNGPVGFNPQNPAQGVGLNPNAGQAGANYALRATELNQNAAQYNQGAWQQFLGSLSGMGTGVAGYAAGNILDKNT